jgi:cytochrome c553
MIIVSLFALSAACAHAADAKANWATLCTPCHGADGSANTNMGKKLNAKNLSDAKVQSEFTDAQAATAIKEGVKEGSKVRMKAFGDKLNEADIKALVAYVRTLKK